MAQAIYNEGRVVGLSAYEIFVKQAIANGVEEIPTESQWLTSMIGCGASMILRIKPATAQVGVNDFTFPSTSNLSAAGVIFASPFIGECAWDEDGAGKWATKVTSYGGLISNTSSSYPTSSTVPSGTYEASEYQNCVSEFLKITDGIVYTQGANWVNSASQPPEKDIDPNFNESSTVVRLYLTEVPRTEIKVLLTGFNNKRILQGLSIVASASGGGSADPSTNDWENGGMLGPEVIPWSSKIIFAVPSSAYALANSLVRTMPNDTALTKDTYSIDGIGIRNVRNGEVKANSIIDFSSITLTDYYDAHSFGSKLPTLKENVGKVTLGNADSTNTLVAWYPGMTAEQLEIEEARSTKSNANFFPPALYASQITQTGTNNRLVPIDVAAPGTVKGFTDQTQAINYKTIMPNNFSIYHNTTNNTFSFVTSSTPSEWSGTTKLTYTSEPEAELVVGTQTLGVVALTKPNGTYYNTGSETITIGSDNVTNPLGKVNWDLLFQALKGELTVDLLGTRLRNIGSELNSNNKMGMTSSTTIGEVGTNTLTLRGNSVSISSKDLGNGKKVASIAQGASVELGDNYIQFTDTANSNRKVRFYICNKAGGPGTTGVPDGSIGIGW